jgi:hypothetical protein
MKQEGFPPKESKSTSQQKKKIKDEAKEGKIKREKFIFEP